MSQPVALPEYVPFALSTTGMVHKGALGWTGRFYAAACSNSASGQFHRSTNGLAVPAGATHASLEADGRKFCKRCFG